MGLAKPPKPKQLVLVSRLVLIALQFGPYCKPKQVVLVFSLAVVAMQCGSCHYLEGGLGIGDWCSFSLPIGVIDAVASLVEEWAGVVLTSCSLSLSIMFCRILNPAASNIRIYYPINKDPVPIYIFQLT